MTKYTITAPAGHEFQAVRCANYFLKECADNHRAKAPLRHGVTFCPPKGVNAPNMYVWGDENHVRVRACVP